MQFLRSLHEKLLFKVLCCLGSLEMIAVVLQLRRGVDLFFFQIKV